MRSVHLLRNQVFTVLLVAMSLCINARAQTVMNPMESLKENKEFIYGVDNRRTHIRQQNTVIYGAFMGFSLGNNLRYKSSISGTLFEVGKFVDPNGLLRKNRLFFVSFGEEFDFFKYKRFSATTYLQIGLGKNFFREIDLSGNEVLRGSNFIAPLEVGLHFNYDINSYLTAKTGFGWRFVFPHEANDLSGYYIKAGLGFNLKKFIEKRQERKTMNAGSL